MLSCAVHRFTYVAILSRVETLLNAHGLLIALVLLMRFVPSFFLCPIAGVAADRCVASLAAIKHLPIVNLERGNLWLLTCADWLKPFCGVYRFSRELVLVTSNVVAAVFVTCFILIQHAKDAW